jgi:O-antigen ligase
MMEYVYWAVEIGLLWYAFKGRREALMVLALSLPFSRRLPSLPLPLLNYENVLFLVALLMLFKEPPRKSEPTGHVHHWIPLGILALLATAAFVNTLLTFEPQIFTRLWGTGYHNVMSYKSFMMCLAFYVLASIGLRSMEDLREVIRWGVLGIMLEAGYTATEYLVLSPGRATGHMGEPNSMGAYLAGSTGLLLALLLLLPRGHPHKRHVLGGFVAAVVALLGTLSRGAYLATAVGSGVLTAMVNRRVLVVGVLFVALNALWLPEKVRHRLDETMISEERLGARFEGGRGEEGSAIIAAINRRMEERAALGEIDESDLRISPSVQARLVVWEASYKIMLDNPFGIGYGVFPWYLPYYSDIVMFKATHNIYLKVGTEIGIAGLLVFLYLIFALTWHALRIGLKAEDVEVRAFGYGMFTYGLALAVCAFVVDVFFQTEVNGQYWLFMGALMQAPALLARGAAEEPSKEEPLEEESKPLYELV